ncbi:MAG TPA: 3-dehydroquinate synthase family protein [Acidimicrobiia bacterium]|nr:3-dehydroquinate synthase family protein [Acidimicrobiia bacterium]
MDSLRITDESEVVFGLAGGPLPPRSDREAVVFLTQPGVAAGVTADLADGVSGLRTLVHVLEDREGAKELEAVGMVYDAMGEFNLGRHDTIVGVGGGAATDVAGFVAATWLRGVESVLVPTTLLAAVDAAIGGKTGINRGGKNLVGAFWLPSRVVVDLDLLAGLPERLLREGAAEAVKAGLLADPVIVEEYSRHGLGADLGVIVPRAIAVKAEVVGDDLTEQGRRAILNFGHTIGHVVEVLAPMPHGHAVSVGMVAAAVLSNARYGFDHRWLTALLFELGLPVAAAGVSIRAALDLVQRDKKRTADGTQMVLLRGVGDPVVELVSPEELEAAMRAIGLS